MALAPGARLGPYEVVAKIGEGGMGEVYRATDTRLRREVALKVLPASLAADPDRLARFQREAEVLASLNHPNIAAIYGLEEAEPLTPPGQPLVRALVMELVEGPTLADRIALGALPVDEALPIARQVAEALAAAHERGIVHRDLKPANVKVRPDGVVKVLDFGLAKALEPASGGVAMSQAPTITTPAMTQAGIVLGTAPYMSPEQARGKPVDRRADIWAFGCVLYELLTGRRAFDGEDVSLTLSQVLQREPDYDALPATVPASVAQALRVCLRKDPGERVSDIRDVRLAMEGAFDSGVGATGLDVRIAPGSATSTWRLVWPWALAALAIGAVAASLVPRGASSAPPSQPLRRFVYTLPATLSLPRDSGTLVGISRDGQRIVYRASDGGAFRLYLRGAADLDGVPVPGTEGNSQTGFFSPDGQWLGFPTNEKLMKVSLGGGNPLEIASLPGPPPRGIQWRSDDTIVLGQNAAGLGTVAANGGQITVMVEPPEGRRGWYPQTLPDGRTVLFTESLGRADSGDVLVFDPVAKTRRIVLPRAAAGHYLPSGHLVFVRDGSLWAVRFELARQEVVGEAVRLEDQIRVESGGAVQMAVGDDGTLAYVAGSDADAARTLVLVDRQGREEPLTGAPQRPYVTLDVAPDGSRAALEIEDGEQDIWLWDFPRQALSRLTFGQGNYERPGWSADGQHVVFATTAFPTSMDGLFRQRADGTGSPESIAAHPRGTGSHAMAPDGRTVVFQAGPTNAADLFVATIGGGEPKPLLATRFNEFNPAISPDGRWLAYQSSESGRMELYVRPFPNVDGGKWQVSTAGGETPVWARRGDELFFRLGDGSVMGVRVEPGATFRASVPVQVVRSGYYEVAFTSYGIAPDGRFLMIKDSEQRQARIVIVQNLLDELRRRLPLP